MYRYRKVIEVATELQAQTRANSKKSMVKELRRKGNIPAVIYGNGVESRPIYVNHGDFIKVIRKAGRNGVITLKVDSDDYPVMVYDLQVDKIKDDILHADFYKVDMTSEVDADVSVHLSGESAGQKEGGVVQQLLHELSVRALPADIPEAIEVQVEQLNIGDSISVSDLKSEAKYEILNDSDDTIVSITPPQAEEPETGEEDGEQEPELVDQNDKKEEE